ncbi:MAG: prepilin-type N-terminal cleavage/methylation domain-containing protein [Patescibacteria group bacterium]
MKRGFTLVELLVVITILAILIGLSVAGVRTYQNRASDSQMRSMANIVASAAERYHSENNEYPSGTLVFGSAPTNSPPASYQTASTRLEIPMSSFTNTNAKLVPCEGPVCSVPTPSPDKERVYYLTKSATESASIRTYTINTSCNYTFPSTETNGASFLVVYYSNEQAKWLISRGAQGGATAPASPCSFTTL